MGRIARRKRGFRDGKRMRILSMLFGNNSGGGASSILDGAPFKAQLITSLILNMGTGSPTYTRATTATFTDFEGVMRTAISGEARFQGARRVRNLITGSSENFSAVGWADVHGGTGSAATATGGFSDPVGGTGAYRIQANRGAGDTVADYSIWRNTTSSACNRRSVWAKSNTGASQTFTMWAAGTGQVVTVTTSWQLVSDLSSTSVSVFDFANYGPSATTRSLDILVYQAQAEDVTGQSVQTAGEYVSVGVLSAPYHGAGVDGVKYFPTLPNGLPISSSTAKYASLPGVAGSYFSTPDSVANSITGDIDIRVKVALNDWTPAAPIALLGKDDGGANRSYNFFVTSSPPGRLVFGATSSGGTIPATYASSSAAPTVSDGDTLWVRVTREYSSGNIIFYTSSSDGATWNQLGAPQSSPAGALTDLNTQVRLGDIAGGSNLSGKIYQAQIYNGINGTLAVNFNANDYQTGTTWAASSTGETWTINGSATIFGAGASAPFDATGPKGYLSEGSRQNICLQSNAFTTTWLQTGTPTPTQNVIGPDGATSAWTMTDNDAGASEYIYQDIALTAAAYTESVYVKKTTGVQPSYPVLLWLSTSGNLGAAATIDTSNGVATVWTAYTGFTINPSSATCVSHNDIYWRVSLTQTATALTYRSYILPAGTTNATQSTGTVDVAAQGSAVFYGAQVELASFASTYIPTTTVAVTRNADVLTYATSGNLNVSVGWAYAECVAGQISATGVVIGDSGSTNGSVIYLDSANAKYSSYDGTTAVVTNPAQTIPASETKVGVTWGGSTRLITSGGLAPTSGGFDGAFSSTSISIGSQNSGSNGFFGTIRNVRIGQSALSAAQLQGITT